MKQNLSNTDRILRFILAFWWLGPLQPVFPWVWANWVILIIGFIALIESFIGYCPVATWLKINGKR